MLRTSIRLTVLGSKRQVQRFINSKWDRRLSARHCELVESSAGRFVCSFEIESSPIEGLRALSERLPDLVFLLDYEIEEKRAKGLLKATAGLVELHQTEY